MSLIETDLVMCSFKEDPNIVGGILFGIRKTRGNPERTYIGMLSFDKNDLIELKTINENVYNFKLWYEVENFVRNLINESERINKRIARV